MTERFNPDRQCKGKRTFGAKRDAKLAARRGVGLSNLQAYRCPHCRKFHLGTKLGTEKRRRAA